MTTSIETRPAASSERSLARCGPDSSWPFIERGKELGQRHFQNAAERRYRIDRNARHTALDPTDENRMKTRVVRQSLLRQPGTLISQLPHTPP